jgi:hypothetical protein
MGPESRRRFGGTDPIALLPEGLGRVRVDVAAAGATVTRWPTPREEHRGDPVDGVFWWTRYPPEDDTAAVAEWTRRFESWCTEHRVDPIAVTVEATRLGLTDQPFSPY